MRRLTIRYPLRMTPRISSCSHHRIIEHRVIKPTIYNLLHRCYLNCKHDNPRQESDVVRIGKCVSKITLITIREAVDIGVQKFARGAPNASTTSASTSMTFSILRSTVSAAAITLVATTIVTGGRTCATNRLVARFRLAYATITAGLAFTAHFAACALLSLSCRKQSN